MPAASLSLECDREARIIVAAISSHTRNLTKAIQYGDKGARAVSGTSPRRDRINDLFRAKEPKNQLSGILGCRDDVSKRSIFSRICGAVFWIAPFHCAFEDQRRVLRDSENHGNPNGTRRG
jgi:hypothetical protein